MAMNREQKRALQRAGQLNEDGTPAASRERRPAPVTAERTPPRQFVREVRSELKKVSWPTRAETLRFSLIVGVGIIVMGLFIFLVDFAVTEGNTWLFDTGSSDNALVVGALLLGRTAPVLHRDRRR